MSERSKIVAVQEDLAVGLGSWSALDRVNVVCERKLRLSGEIERNAIWMTPRSGRSGLGIMVEMPTIELGSESAPGPDETLVLGVVIIEEPNTNLEPTVGTLIDAETAGRMVRRFGHGWFVREFGELYCPSARAMEPADEYDQQGLVAYRVKFRLQLQDEPLRRLTCPEITEADLVVTLALAAGEEGAEIYYSTDGSLPGSANDGARRYEGPFGVEVGTVLRWAAWPGTAGVTTEWLPSAVDKATVH